VRALSLCSGCGGLDLGLELLGWSFVAQAENDRACSLILARHWPDVPNLGDLRAVDWERRGIAADVCGRRLPLPARLPGRSPTRRG
jgi:site-specific DNA-cytosine methylase